tara:strand:- start:89 stop:832 length:744 start_codon:yes stop_codon:yes gene_type:complete
MSLKLARNLSRYYSINFSLPKRTKNKITHIILHYTGMKKESEAIKKLCSHKSNVSSHYFIKKNGQLLNLVPDLYTAWHAGKSNWKKLSSLNKCSIGIEISNPGHDYGYKNFSLNQINSLIKLLRYLSKKYNIRKQNILGHSDIAPNRKKDPGEKFPWKKLADKNLCHWHYLSEHETRKKRYLKVDNHEEKKFLNNLYKIGYSKKDNTKLKHNKTNLIIAFQRKYRQSLINGKIDQECLLISKNLIKL